MAAVCFYNRCPAERGHIRKPLFLFPLCADKCCYNASHFTLLQEQQHSQQSHPFYAAHWDQYKHERDSSVSGCGCSLHRPSAQRLSGLQPIVQYWVSCRLDLLIIFYFIFF